MYVYLFLIAVWLLVILAVCSPSFTILFPISLILYCKATRANKREPDRYTPRQISNRRQFLIISSAGLFYFFFVVAITIHVTNNPIAFM